MKRLLTILMAIALMAAALPAFADTDGYPDNILLENGIPYGNYGFPGLVKLHKGDMDKVNAHMRSARANQQGAGISYQFQASITAGSTAPANDLSAQLLARLQSNPEFTEFAAHLSEYLRELGQTAQNPTLISQVFSMRKDDPAYPS